MHGRIGGGHSSKITTTSALIASFLPKESKPSLVLAFMLTLLMSMERREARLSLILLIWGLSLYPSRVIVASRLMMDGSVFSRIAFNSFFESASFHFLSSGGN